MKTEVSWCLQPDTTCSCSPNCLKMLLKKRLAIPTASTVLEQGARITSGGKVSDKVHREVLERVGSFKSKGGDGWDHRVGEYFVCLANCTLGNIFLDVGREAWPPVILRKEGNGLQVAAMATL